MDRHAYVVVGAENQEPRQGVFWSLMNQGMLSTPSLMGCVSNPMGEAEVDTFVECFRQVVHRNTR